MKLSMKYSMSSLSRDAVIGYCTSSNTFTKIISTLKRKRFLAYFVLATFCWVLIVYAKGHQERPNTVVRLSSSVAEPETSVKVEFTINQPGCRISNMSAFGPSVTVFLKPMRPARCEFGPQAKDERRNERAPAIVLDDVTSLSIDRSSLKYYNKTRISCSYSSFYRPNFNDWSANDSPIDGAIIFSNDMKQLSSHEPTIITSETDEFVRVTCMDTQSSNERSDEPFYQDYFASVPRKKQVEKRCRRIDRTLPSDHRRANILIIGLDALSRLNFQRQMPSSYKYLIEEMSAIEMYGYNKVGDNTFPNLVPLLIGKTVEELKEVCWNSSSTFDNCPFVWNEYRGYRTIFAEDTPYLAVFNYLKKGFRRQPTDYYLRPFFIEAERKIGFYQPQGSPLCLGARLSLSIILNYALKHVRVWNQTENFFGFFWSTGFTHDTFNLNPEGDVALREFLERYRQSDKSNNTILVMVSDHGLRWGAFRETHQGRLEERLPLLKFVLPDWFEREYPRAVANLRLNQDRLTTPFDLHDTLIDLADPVRSIKSDVIDLREAKIASSRSRSLFLPIDVNRTCEKGGIPSTYCTCRDKIRKLDANDMRSVEMAELIVIQLNSLLRDRPECAPLAIDKLEQITAETSTEGGGQENSTAVVLRFVLVTVRLRPGGGLFEGTLRYYDDTLTYKLVGQVSRINAYGSQSFCVDDSTLKLYCYCRHQETDRF